MPGAGKCLPRPPLLCNGATRQWAQLAQACKSFGGSIDPYDGDDEAVGTPERELGKAAIVGRCWPEDLLPRR